MNVNCFNGGMLEHEPMMFFDKIILLTVKLNINIKGNEV